MMTTIFRLQPPEAARRSVLHVLVMSQSVEDARLVRELLQGQPDVRTYAARDLADAEAILRDNPVEAILVDRRLWNGASPEAMAFVKASRPDVAVMFLTDGGGEDGTLPPVELQAHELVNTRGLSREELMARLTGAVDESRTVRRRDTMIRWLEREARTDHLTGLHNRHAFDDELRAVCRRAREGSQPVALVFVNITGTSAVNETYGHETGDDMIRRAAAGIAHCLRASDFAARIGGDDFGIIIPEGNLELGRRVARRVAHQMERMNADEWAHEIPVSLVFGVVSGVDCEPADLLAAAEAQVASHPAGRMMPVPSMEEDDDGPSVA
jgi:diguanylate cyclase (GGDEF)-like protein